MSIERRRLLAATALAAAGLTGACSGSGASGASGSRRAQGPRSDAPASPPGGTATPATTPSTTPAPAGRIPSGEVVHGPRSGHRIALTFHGAGDANVAENLLRELESGGAHVTVMVVGTWLDEFPRLARRILDGGHELGNHTQNHVDIEAMNAAGAYAEIAQCAERLRKLTGSIGTWFRPSQAQHVTPLVRAAAARAGYRGCLSYDVDSRDFTDPAPATVTGTVLGAVRPGSIVSMHFGHRGTVTAMPAILAGLRSKGLTPVTATDLVTR